MDTEKIEGSVYKYDKCADCGGYVRWKPRAHDKLVRKNPIICVPCLEERTRFLHERFATRSISVSASKYTGIEVRTTEADGEKNLNCLDVFDPCVAEILQKNYGWMPPEAGTQPTEPLAEQATEP
ncbi:MAG TPA: hypothetical protein PK916_08990 [Bacteroidota bacterium]|nr:hypothetical protein [Bacteroidota bacterium]